MRAAHILALADSLERRAREAARRPEARTVVAATRHGFHALRLAPRATVGRGRDCALVLGNARVSREHAALSVRGGVLWIEDLGSRNGTFATGERVSLRAVAPGEEVRFGDEPVRFWLR